MDQLPFLAMLFASIPEAMALLIIGLVLFKYDVKTELPKILAIAAIFSFYCYITRPFFDSMEFIFLTGILAMIVLVHLLLKVSIKESIFVVFFGVLIITVSQALIGSLVLGLLGLTLEEAWQILWLRILIPWCYILPVLALAHLCYYRNLSITDLRGFLKSLKPKHKLIQTLVLILIVQLVVIFIFGVEYWTKGAPTPKAIFMAFTLGLLAISYIVVSKKMFMTVEQEALIETQDTFVEQIESLFTNIRAQRHDFLNHVQVLHGLIAINDIKESQNYINGLLGEIKEINTLIGVKNPVIAALLKTKLALAERSDITLNIYVFTDLSALKVKSYKIVKVLGNLIDNAMEAVGNQPIPERKVTVNIKKEKDFYLFEVNNLGALIDSADLEKIFTPGYTTKKDKEDHGVGLAVVKDLVKECQGQVDVQSNIHDGTTFKVSFPA